MIRCHALYGKDRKRCRRKQGHAGAHSTRITAQEMQEVIQSMEKARAVPDRMQRPRWASDE